ncbi:MAG: hypothetical protein V3T88_09070 [Nitrosomonadaceae bacterium]
MAFDSTGLTAMGGERQAFDKGKMFAYTTSDALATVRASGYFDDISSTLDSEYFIAVKASDGVSILALTRDSTGLILTTDTNIQALSGAGAVDVITGVTEVTSTGAGDALTIADGYIGQRKVVVHVVDGGSSVLTPANGLGYTTVTFTTAGEAVELVFLAGGWAVIGIGGLSATLPAVA